MTDGSKQKLNNRERMPEVAKVVDELTAVFGEGFKVLWAKEGDLELGVPLDRSGLVRPSISVAVEEQLNNKKGVKKQKR